MWSVKNYPPDDNIDVDEGDRSGEKESTVVPVYSRIYSPKKQLKPN